MKNHPYRPFNEKTGKPAQDNAHRKVNKFVKNHVCLYVTAESRKRKKEIKLVEGKKMIEAYAVAISKRSREGRTE